MNDVELARVQDDRLPPGQVALVGAAYSAASYRLSYDNVQIEPGARDIAQPSEFDTFDGTSPQWTTSADRGSRIDVRDGEFVLVVSSKDWSAEAYSDDQFTAVTFSTDFRMTGIAPDARIGATCHTTLEFDQYLFVLAFDGSFAVQAIVAGEFIEILPWTYGSGLLIEPDSVNHMTVTCADDRVIWVLNGQTLVDAEGAGIEAGRIGFIAYTYEYGQLEMRIDNVLIIDESG